MKHQVLSLLVAALLLGCGSDADHRKSSDPDERTRHYIDVDFFEPYPFRGVPRTLEGMRRKYGAEDAVKWGVAPWAVAECYRMMVLSLEQGDWASAGAVEYIRDLIRKN